MKHLFHIFDNFKTRKKLLIIYILFGLIPFFCLATYSTYKSYSSIISEYQQVLKTENHRIKNVFFEVMYLFTNFSKQIQRDNELETLLTYNYNNDEELYKTYRNYTNLDTIKKNFSEVADIHIYYENSTMKPSGYFYETTPEIKEYEWYKNIHKSPSQITWFYNTDISKFGKLHLGKMINLTGNKSATLIITVSDYFLNYINQESEISSVFVLDDQTIFFSNSDEINTTSFSKLPLSKNFELEKNIINSDDINKYLVYASQCRGISSDNYFQLISINSSAVNNAIKTSFEYGIWMICSVVIPLIAILLFVSHFNKRILILKNQMENITSENYNILSWTESNDELGVLFKQMIKTITSIKELNETIYHEKLEKENLKLLHNQMKYETLTNQINPHFIFNSLETIRMKAEENDDYEVSYISELLGQLLQYSLHIRNGQTSLSKELLYAEKYLCFQKIRFNNRFSYEFDIKNIDTEKYAILPMLLQPIIENSIKHGFENQPEYCYIKISVFKDQKFLYISVYDNGVGMNNDILQKQLYRLRNSFIDDSKPENDDRIHIGLSNIYHRIKIFYGEEYTVNLDSEPMHGTTVTLCLPANNPIDNVKKGDNNNV